jgi:flagellar protein FliS
MYRDAYLETEILCASPVRLVELLYRGAMEAVRSAGVALAAGEIADRNRQIAKAQAILSELSLSLDHTTGGRLSRDLVELYDYMQRRLNEANARQSGEPIAEVGTLLQTLLSAWVEIAARDSSAAVEFPMAANQGAGQFGGVDLEGARLDRLA